jgi:hypothetical protein
MSERGELAPLRRRTSREGVAHAQDETRMAGEPLGTPDHNHLCLVIGFAEQR